MWHQLQHDYTIDDAAGLSLLRAAVEAFDRSQQARKLIAREGPTVADRYGQTKAHPAVAIERAWSVGAADTLGARPWSVTGRTDPDKFLRANPRIARGRVSSAIVGAVARYQLGDVRMRATGKLEVPWESPSDERFGQATFDGTIQFPTFGLQRFRGDLHVVATVGDTAPPQRFAYLGGSGTLPIVDETLSMGGDQLLHLDSRYEIPFPRAKLPFLGPPTLSIRHRVGSAGVRRLPRFVQNVGAQVTLSFFRLDYTIDPATRTDRFKAGLSFAR